MRYRIRNRATKKEQWVDQQGWDLLTSKGMSKLFDVVEKDKDAPSIAHPRPLEKKIALPEPVEIKEKRRKAKTEAPAGPETN